MYEICLDSTLDSTCNILKALGELVLVSVLSKNSIILSSLKISSVLIFAGDGFVLVLPKYSVYSDKDRAEELKTFATLGF